MMCLLVGLGNENEGMRIKCVCLTQFGNKEWEFNSHGGWEWKCGNKNET